MLVSSVSYLKGSHTFTPSFQHTGPLLASPMASGIS